MHEEDEIPLEAMQMSVLHVAQAPFGEYFFEFMKRICFINETTYDGDVNRTLVAEGRRQVYLELNDALEAAYKNVGPGGVPIDETLPTDTIEAQDTLEEDDA